MVKNFLNKLFSSEESSKPKAQSSSKGPRLLPPLSNFKPFSDLPKSSQILMASFAEQEAFRFGHPLFKQGADDDVDYFLLDGAVTLKAQDGNSSEVKSDTAKASTAIGFLRPRQLSGIVRSFEATFYAVPHHIVEMVYEQTREAASAHSDFEVTIGDMPEKTVLERVEAEITQGDLLLTSLPEVAMKVKQACNDEEASLDDIADIISRDASMTIKLIQSANSPIYRGAVDVKSITDAVCRLGKQVTQHLVFYFATKELFQPPVKALDAAFRRAWNDSLRRAIMARTVAKLSKADFNPDTAFLCGLFFRIGDLLIFQYVAKNIRDAQALEKVQQINEEKSATNSRLVVSKWNLPEEVMSVLNDGGSWAYESNTEQGDYSDLVIATNVLLRVMNKNLKGLPSIEDIPAVKKIINKEFAASSSVMLEYRKALKEFK